MNKFLFQTKLQAIMLSERVPTGQHEAPDWYNKLQDVLLGTGSTLNPVDKKSIQTACARVRNQAVKDLVKFQG